MLANKKATSNLRFKHCNGPVKSDGHVSWRSEFTRKTGEKVTYQRLIERAARRATMRKRRTEKRAVMKKREAKEGDGNGWEFDVSISLVHVFPGDVSI
jgi:hypothetical protein